MTVAQKVRENRARRMADRQGLRLDKSHAKDPLSLTYGGWQIFDLQSETVVLGGEGNMGRGFSATMDEVEKYLTGRRTTPSRRRRK